MWRLGHRIHCVGGQVVGDDIYFGNGVGSDRERLAVLPRDPGKASYFFGKKSLVPRRSTIVTRSFYCESNDVHQKPHTYFHGVMVDKHREKAGEQQTRLRKPLDGNISEPW